MLKQTLLFFCLIALNCLVANARSKLKNKIKDAKSECLTRCSEGVKEIRNSKTHSGTQWACKCNKSPSSNQERYYQIVKEGENFVVNATSKKDFIKNFVMSEERQKAKEAKRAKRAKKN